MRKKMGSYVILITRVIDIFDNCLITSTRDDYMIQYYNN